MEEFIFQTCQNINELLQEKRDNTAREELIKLLDYHNTNQLEYNPLINHLIRETGLFPYLSEKTSSWEERFIYDIFKVNVGAESPVTLHREQSLLLKKLLDGQNLAISAPTSFGKSFVIDAFIEIRKPANVMIIVPTIALTDETRRRLYRKFSREYKIITTADVEPSEKNIFIFPQERALNYLNKIDSIDIMIVDEFYKASYKFDKERSPSLVKAIIKLGDKAKQRYFLAPNITKLEDNPFTKDMEFLHLDFNTVYLEKYELYRDINKDNQKKADVLLKILSSKKTKSLIYAGTYSNIDSISTILLANLPEQNNQLLQQFSEWLGKNYDYNWSLTNLVKRGVGIHNGRLHRSLSQIQVKLFEETEGIDSIISTSSIIEGVNTSAENVVIWMNKNGSSGLNDFTYRNIMGRGGRMFKHFIGRIYILDKPPATEQTQLNIDFPDEILGDLNEKTHNKILTKDQVAKIVYYQEEMSEVLGNAVFNRLKEESAFQSSNAELIKKIAFDMFRTPENWNGLGFLNSTNRSQWDRSLYTIINLQPGNWETKSSSFVAFIKTLRDNWYKSIPELLKDLEPYDIGLDQFFQLERNVSFKFAALLKDVNTLQKEILKDKGYDISRFANHVSHAFLPPIVYQLEEYGLPRILSKKIHVAKLIDLTNKELTIHGVIEYFNNMGSKYLKSAVNFEPFEHYILDYFYEGIRLVER